MPGRKNKGGSSSRSKSKRMPGGARPGAPNDDMVEEQPEEYQPVVPEYHCLRMCSGGGFMGYDDGKVSVTWTVNHAKEELRGAVPNPECIRWCVGEQKPRGKATQA